MSNAIRRSANNAPRSCTGMQALVPLVAPLQFSLRPEYNVSSDVQSRVTETVNLTLCPLKDQPINEEFT
jgi:hypothetical protein